MQLCNINVRLAGSLNNTVHKQDATPAEILILRHIHGDDAVVDIRPTKFDKQRQQGDEYERLSKFYDRRAGGFTSQPGEEKQSIMQRLFPGAMAKLPTTLEEIGIESPVPAPIEPKRGRKAKAPEPELVVGPIEDEDDEPEVAENKPVTMSFATGPEGDGEGEPVDDEGNSVEAEA